MNTTYDHNPNIDSEEIIANIQGICATTLAKVEGRE